MSDLRTVEEVQDLYKQYQAKVQEIETRKALIAERKKQAEQLRSQLVLKFGEKFESVILDDINRLSVWVRDSKKSKEVIL